MLARSPCDICGKREIACYLTEVESAPRTWSSPAEAIQVCRTCVATDDHDNAHERAAARARNNDFADTNGRDWT